MVKADWSIFEEDYWAVPGSRKAMAAYHEAREAADPDHPQKRTRLDWGSGPAWARGARSWFERAGAQ